MEQLINILIALGGVGFFGWLIMMGRKDSKEGPKETFDPFTEGDYKPKSPDLNEIKKGIENETPQESIDNVNDLLDDLFGDE